MRGKNVQSVQFQCGPAVLPEEVLQEAADEMLDYRGCGMSVMEMSHRSGTYQKIIDEAEADLRQLMGSLITIKCCFYRVAQASSLR